MTPCFLEQFICMAPEPLRHFGPSDRHDNGMVLLPRLIPLTYRVFFVFVIALALSAALIDQQTKEEFKDFLHKFKKEYRDPVEYAKRLAIFAKNRAAMIAHNHKFADETKEEFLKHLGLPPGPAPNMTNHRAISAADYFRKRPVKRDLVDWRAAGKVSSVKDQGGCGSCWTFSASAVVETCVAIATNTVPDASEQQYQDCLESKQCSPGGGWPSGALQFTIDQGQSLLQDYPYTKSDGQCHSTDTKLHVGSRIGGNGEGDLENMLQKGAVSVCLDASVLQSYGGGVIDADSSSETNHAVTVVALTNDCDGKADECWVVKNSWTNGWGEQGYFRVVKGKNSIGVANVVDTAIDCSMDGNNDGGNQGQYGPIEQIDRPGGDIQVGTASSAQDCQTQCYQNNDCTTWAFDSCGNTCWLKNGDLNAYQADCRVSGVITANRN
ncbi:cathepsin L precursor [Planoprotostelium fungivorum]|uniref:Cathepsin L n=1 Tax=Planoprotostelium fungivorum TaxID=1890364 RepID=A0A2P6N6L8_9EUKA|nr:cathepsin L precursor [Planoprotostelium fungivorum]